MKQLELELEDAQDTIAEQIAIARKCAEVAGLTPNEIGALLEDKFGLTYYEGE